MRFKTGDWENSSAIFTDQAVNHQRPTTSVFRVCLTEMHWNYCISIVFLSVFVILSELTPAALNSRTALSQYYRQIFPADNVEFKITKYRKTKALDELSCLLECHSNKNCNGVMFEVNKSYCFIIFRIVGEPQAVMKTVPAAQPTEGTASETSKTTTTAAPTTAAATTTSATPTPTPFTFRRNRKRSLLIKLRRWNVLSILGGAVGATLNWVISGRSTLGSNGRVCLLDHDGGGGSMKFLPRYQ